MIVNVFNKLLPQIKDLNGNTIENIETVFEYDRYACNDFMEKAIPLLNREYPLLRNFDRCV